MRAEYDFSGGVRGRYVKAYLKSRSVVLLDPDVAAAFRNDREVNRALRVYLRGRPK
jgi:hypothetical protein